MDRDRFARLGTSLFILFLSIPGWAQITAKVLKAKGNKAIIRIDSGGRLERGDRLDVSFAGESYDSVSSSSSSRKKFIGGEFSYTASSTDVSRENVPDETVETSSIALECLYGWNYKKYEFGGEIDYLSQTEDSETTSSLALGGFFEYNFMKPNTIKTKLVPAAGASLAIRTANLNSSSGSGVLFSVYGGVKYFVLTDTLAVTGFLELERDSVSYDNGRDDVSMNTRVTVGLRQYL